MVVLRHVCVFAFCIPNAASNDTRMYTLMHNYTGGLSIHSTMPDLSARMELAAEILNLHGHYVWNGERTEKTKVRDCTMI